MKTLSDGTEVSPRSWYYLLDWNDRDNWQFMQKQFGKIRLHDLTIIEYRLLFSKATASEFSEL